jgi:hypothetical protein
MQPAMAQHMCRAIGKEVIVDGCETRLLEKMRKSI